MAFPHSPVFICLPAMGVPADYYRNFASALACASGGSVVTPDLRGQGTDLHRAARGDQFGYREIVEVDLPSAVSQWRQAFPDRPLFLVGHSLGGQLAVLASAELGSRISGLVLVAAGTAHFRAWPSHLRRRARLTVAAIRAAAAVLPWYPGQLLGFGGTQPRRLMRDWGHNASTGQYRMEGSARDARALREELARVRLPVLSLSLADDPLAPAGAVEELLSLLPQASIERQQVARPGQANPWRRHFTWARAPDEIASRIAIWAARRAGVRDAATETSRSISRNFIAAA